MDTKQIAPEELAAFWRFCECAEDGEGHDVEKDMMRRLRVAGLIMHRGGGYYQTTDLGMHLRSQLPKDFSA